MFFLKNLNFESERTEDLELLRPSRRKRKSLEKELQTTRSLTIFGKFLILIKNKIFSNFLPNFSISGGAGRTKGINFWGCQTINASGKIHDLFA